MLEQRLEAREGRKKGPDQSIRCCITNRLSDKKPSKESQKGLTDKYGGNLLF